MGDLPDWGKTQWLSQLLQWACQEELTSLEVSQSQGGAVQAEASGASVERRCGLGLFPDIARARRRLTGSPALTPHAGIATARLASTASRGELLLTLVDAAEALQIASSCRRIDPITRRTDSPASQLNAPISDTEFAISNSPALHCRRAEVRNHDTLAQPEQASRLSPWPKPGDWKGHQRTAVLESPTAWTGEVEVCGWAAEGL